MIIDPVTGSVPLQVTELKVEKRQAQDTPKAIENTGESDGSRLDNDRQNIAKNRRTKSFTKEDEPLMYNSMGSAVAGGQPDQSAEKGIEPIDIVT